MEIQKTILDGNGYVKLIDISGDDMRIVNSARMSFGAKTQGKTLEENVRLLTRLYKDEHMSPFEMVDIMFEIKLPISAARQLLRHRTQSINEVSTRYTEVKEEFYIPPVERFCYQSMTNKQCSGEQMSREQAEVQRASFVKATETSFQIYQDMIKSGVAREIARGVLPLDTYTRLISKMNLRNFFHFAKLRLADDAQWEIRQVAKACYELVKESGKLDNSCKAFEDYPSKRVKKD